MGKHRWTRRPGGRPRLRAALAVSMVGLVCTVAAGTSWAEEAGQVEVGRAEVGRVGGTPCTAAADACVDLDARLAWLLDAGVVVRGPVPISSGGPGHGTPRGEHRVEWKHKDHRSAEFNGAPMPFAVFFAEGGIAFHEGNLHTPSAGCVRLAYDDAMAFYERLAVGDVVQVR